MKYWKSLYLVALMSAVACNAQAQSGLPAVLPADFETRAALAAGPEQVRAGAGVFLLGEDGYYRARESENGFNCFVERDSSPNSSSMAPNRQLFAPQCFDAEGSRTLLTYFVDRSRLQRREGLPQQTVDSILSANEMLYTPRRAGIVYMSSALNTLNSPEDPREGAFINYVPHVMFLAPNLTNDSVNAGMSRTLENFLSGWPFLPGRGGALGLIIVPLDRQLQVKIRADQRDLARELQRYIPRNMVSMM